MALYDIEVSNEIIPYNGGRFYLTAARAASQRGRARTQRAGSARRVRDAAFTWSRNRYLDYVVDSTYLGSPGATADFSGHKVMGVPDVMANAEVGVEIRGTYAPRVKLGIEHASSYFADDANRVRVAGHSILNFTLEWRQPLVSAGGVGIRGFVIGAEPGRHAIHRLGVPESRPGQRAAGGLRAGDAEDGDRVVHGSAAAVANGVI